MTGRFRVTAARAVPLAVTGINATSVSGRIVFNLAIAIQSALPASAPVQCSFTASVFEASLAGQPITETATVPAVRRGTAATCSATIPYSWPLATPAADTVTLGYSVFSLSPALGRESFVGLPAIRVPANGATSTQNIKTVL